MSLSQQKSHFNNIKVIGFNVNVLNLHELTIQSK